MKVIAHRDPQIVDVNGKRGRVFTGRNEDGDITQVTIFESGGETVEIDVSTLKMPDVGKKP